MDIVRSLSDQKHVQRFQQVCGLEFQNDRNLSKQHYTIKYSLPYYLAAVGAFMGDEIFYLTFYPFVIWNMDSVLGRQTVWVWTLVMYLGQATKDYLKVPRPRSPPVIHLETHHLNEFSLPSTHAMAGTAMPVVMAYLLLLRYEFPVWLAISCVPIWTVLTCLSRLYLGVHTILDVLCGIVYALVIMAVTMPYLSEVDIFFQSHPLSPFVVWIICLAAVTVCYPAQGKDVAKGSGVRIVAIYMGFSTGMWMNYQFGLSTIPETSLPYHIMTPSLNWVIYSLLRFVFGAVLLAVVKLVLQKLTVRYFSYLANLETPNKLHPSVETSYIISTYSVVGFCLTSVIPYMFQYIGISRSAQSEIF
ncbi:hypothetical protein LOTGIDRAFT_140415 [Lottia gigantea]|uniref:Phosphatidic acid phosphatase type 2/haloperoxidase domain-containing protein n=1 Tax=Lottia gigantea TaxID=225164 RepID=V4AU84_LOTGI|nr:hypothetical protein LOTGIDRAFT_140415 [Lottia gigantea]ESP00838.1 hypothetical protein LOTGIDRAFT_140415 [Lottia gigantea]